MKALFLAAAIMSLTIPLAALEPFILDADHARLEAPSGLVLRANTDLESPVVPGALGFGLSSEDQRFSDAILRVGLDADESAEVELKAEYVGGTPFLFTRRLYVNQPGPDSVLWRVPNADTLSTFTLTLRAASPIEARVEAVTITPPSAYLFADRILAESSNPIRLINPLEPVKDGMLRVSVQLPRDSENEVIGAEIVLLVDGSRHAATIESVRRDEEAGTLYAGIEVPWPTVTNQPVTIALYDDASRRAVGGIDAVLAPLEGDWRRLPDQSAQSVAPIVRNGELAIYTITSPPGVLESRLGIAHPGETIWLSVTPDLSEWVAEQPVIRSRRDNSALAGGPRAMAVSTERAALAAAFAVVDLQGNHSLYFGAALNSLRFVPIANNPIVKPDVPGLRYRGNALLQMPNSRLLLTLAHDGTKPRLFAHAGNQYPNWLDLGEPTGLPLSPPDARLSGFTENGLSVLLVGKPWRLYSSRDPLYTWTEHAVQLPADLETAQLVVWQDAIHYVGVSRYNQVGVVRWGALPLTLAQIELERETRP